LDDSVGNTLGSVGATSGWTSAPNRRAVCSIAPKVIISLGSRCFKANQTNEVSPRDWPTACACPVVRELSGHEAGAADERKAEGHRQPGIDEAEGRRDDRRKQELRQRDPYQHPAYLHRPIVLNRHEVQRNDERGGEDGEAEKEKKKRMSGTLPRATKCLPGAAKIALVLRERWPKSWHRARHGRQASRSPRLGWRGHAGREAGVDFFGIERCDGSGCRKGYGRAVLVADPRHAAG
jgi:hypothetical protein